MVQTGGGYKPLLEFLEHKGFFYGSKYNEIWMLRKIKVFAFLNQLMFLLFNYFQFYF